MGFFLAVDAGGTKADLVLADETRELARVRTGTIKRMRVDAETAAANLDSGLAELENESGIPMSRVTRTCIGTAGESVPLVVDWLREAFAARVAGDLIVVGDVEIALDAAFPGEAGVLVLAGTGSNVAGRGVDGAVSTIGGWGPALGDEGSGYRIGQEALRAAFLALDAGGPTKLMKAIIKFWELESLERLVEFANGIPAPDFSQLTAVVVAGARMGDELALEILRKQGDALGYLVRLMIRRLKDGTDWTPQIAFAGSIMERVRPVRDALIDAVRAEFPEMVTLNGVVDPTAGALWRARTGSSL